jgi:putative salt-induced outer membrane protein YdiY
LVSASRSAAVVVVLLQLALAGPVAAQESSSADHDDFLALEHLLLTASAVKDTITLDQIVAPDFVFRADPDVERAAWLKATQAMCWSERRDIDRLDVRRFGETVTATFRLTIYADPQTCRPAVLRSLVTSLWTRRDGRYQLVLRQAAPFAAVGTQWARQQFTKVSEQPVRFDGKAELSFVATAGNASSQTIGTGGEFAFRPDGWATQVKTNFVSTRTAKGVGQAFGIDLRQSHRASNKVEMYGHAGFVRDEFAGINHRYTVDAGLGYPLAKHGRQSFKFDIGLGYTREERVGGPSPTFPSGVFSTTWGWAVLPSVGLANEMHGTSNLTHAPDWRLSNAFSVTISLSRLLALKLSDKVNYLNRPVPGFVKTDSVTSAALVVQFAK